MFSPPSFESFGFFEVMQFVVVLILVVVVWRERGAFVAGTQLVLKRFRFDENPNAPVRIEISGRLSGIVSWILNILRVEPEYQFLAAQDSVSIRFDSLRGTRHIFIPLSAVTATECGYQRSILAFAVAVLFTFECVANIIRGFLFSTRAETGTYMGLAFGSMVIAGVATAIWLLSKKIGLSLEGSRHTHGLIFKRSVIENVGVELPQALKAIELLNRLVLEAKTTHVPLAASAAAAAVGPGFQARPDAAEKMCPRCAAVNSRSVRFCENCGFALL